MSDRSTLPPTDRPLPQNRVALSTWQSDRIRRWVAAPLAGVGLAVLGLGLTASPLFDVRTIVVTGAARVPRQQVVQQAGLDRRANVYWFRTAGAERGLQQDPWISSAAITRELPHTIRIHVVERRPTARVQVGSTWLLLSGDGTVLGPGGRHLRLPVLPATRAVTLGRRSPSLAVPASVAGRMSPWLRSRVQSVLPVSSGDVVLELARGARVMLGPPSDLGAKIHALAGIVRWTARHHRRFQYVDLRAPLAPAARLSAPAAG